MNKSMNLLQIKENNMLNIVKNFFKKFFWKRSRDIKINNINEYEENSDKQSVSDFVSDVGFINNDKKLIDLQNRYRRGEIKEKDLTLQQLKQLNNLYDKQIKELKVSNEFRRQRLLKSKEKLTNIDIKINKK